VAPPNPEPGYSSVPLLPNANATARVFTFDELKLRDWESLQAKKTSVQF
jgi:hypothetical protein